MVQTSTSASFRFFGAITAIVGILYLVQAYTRTEWVIHSDILLAITILSGVATLWAFFG